jgi:hypothetical protein
MAPFSRLFSLAAAACLYGAIALTIPVALAQPANEPSKADSTAYKAGETAGSAWQSGKEAARKAWDSTKEAARNVWHSGKETAKDAWSTTKEKTSEVTRDVKDGFQDGKK